MLDSEALARRDGPQLQKRVLVGYSRLLSRRHIALSDVPLASLEPLVIGRVHSWPVLCAMSVRRTPPAVPSPL